MMNIFYFYTGDKFFMLTKHHHMLFVCQRKGSPVRRSLIPGTSGRYSTKSICGGSTAADWKGKTKNMHSRCHCQYRRFAIIVHVTYSLRKSLLLREMWPQLSKYYVQTRLDIITLFLTNSSIPLIYSPQQIQLFSTKKSKILAF